MRYASILVGIGALIMVIAPAGNATIVTTGDTPVGIGPGDTTLTTFVAIGDSAAATLKINSGSKLTHATNPFLDSAKQAASTASVTVTGTNGGLSTLSMEGTDGTFGAFLTIGGSGNGTLNVNDGGLVSIDALGADLGGCCGAGFWAGRDAGGQGTINLTGTDAEIRVDGKHSFISLGQDGSAQMSITDNAKLTVLGDNTSMQVGRFGTGVLNINTGGEIDELLFLNVGGGVGPDGTLNVDGPNARIELKGITTADTEFSVPGVGALLTVGAQGTGVVNITNGEKLFSTRVPRPVMEHLCRSVARGLILVVTMISGLAEPGL